MEISKQNLSKLALSAILCLFVFLAFNSRPVLGQKLNPVATDDSGDSTAQKVGTTTKSKTSSRKQRKNKRRASKKNPQKTGANKESNPSKTGTGTPRSTESDSTMPSFADGPSLPVAPPAITPIHARLDSKTPSQGLYPKTSPEENPESEDAESDGNYYNDNSEDVLNPFNIESVKKHIHKLTAPPQSKKSKNGTHKETHKAPPKKIVPPDPSKTPFTPEWNEAHGRRVLAIMAIMILALFCAPPITRKIVRFMTQGREANETIKRIGTTTQLGSKFTLIGVLLLGLLEILREFQIDVGPMLTGAGIFGVALGFAGQNILKDLLAGAFIIIEEQIRVGDFVKIAGISGTVEEISLRKIQLRDFNGNMLYVPNSQVDVVVNMTREFSRYVIDIPVAYKEDFNDVVKVLGEIDEEIRADERFKKVITEPLTIFGLSHFGTNGYTVTVRTTTKPGEQWSAAREYRKRIKEKFDQLNIEIPVSQMTIHTGHDKLGQAEPISIEKLKC